MRLSGAFSEGAQALFDRLAAIKFPTPIAAGSLSYLAARQIWADWWMRIFQRNILNVVAKPIASGIRIFNALAPTALPKDYAAGVADTVPLIRHPQPLDSDSADSDSETEPQGSEDEQPSIASTLPVSTLDDKSDANSSGDEHPSIPPTLVVPTSDEDTEVQQ
jgi:hypothetical protein